MNRHHLTRLTGIALLLFAGASSGQTASPSAKSSPLELRNDLRISKIIERGQSIHRFDARSMTSTLRKDGTLVSYIYDTNGQLNRAEFSNGTVHTAQYDDAGNLYALISTSGAALQISGDLRNGRKAKKVPVSQIAVPSARGTSTSDNPSAAKAHAATSELSPARFEDNLVAFLVAADGWDTNTPGTDSCDEEANDPVGGPGSTEALSEQSFASDEEPPSTDCTIVVVPGTGESGGGGTGGGGSGAISTGPLPPGTAPSDSPTRADCMAAAYRAYEQYAAYCNTRTVATRQACHADNATRYSNEVSYCNANYP